MPQTKAPHSDIKPQPVQEDSPRWLTMYRDMLRIRFFEEQVNDLYRTARMPGLAHLYSGEEAVAVGVCQTLRRDDYITSTHRGHGHCLAKGASVDRMFAELLGKEPGYCRGKGGSMHIADQDTGNLGANAIVGGSAGIATGAAFSSKMRNSEQVAVCFFGDGALGQGVLYEVMNMAALWKLPIIYVCENNLYNEYTHNVGDDCRQHGWTRRGFRHSHRGDRRAGCAAGLCHCPALVERGAARETVRDFCLPIPIAYHGHHVGDIQRTYYRSKEEEELLEDGARSHHDAWELAARRKNWLMPSIWSACSAEVQAEIAAGVEFGLDAPFPEISEVTENVYA